MDEEILYYTWEITWSTLMFLVSVQTEIKKNVLFFGVIESMVKMNKGTFMHKNKCSEHSLKLLIFHQ